jgi:hypothetical protein
VDLLGVVLQRPLLLQKVLSQQAQHRILIGLRHFGLLNKARIRIGRAVDSGLDKGCGLLDGSQCTESITIGR